MKYLTKVKGQYGYTSVWEQHYQCAVGRCSSIAFRSKGLASVTIFFSGQVSEGETTPLLVVAVGATTGLLLAFILVTALIVVSVVIWLRRRREIKSPPEEEAYYQGADDNDSPENQSVSHISHSDYDDNLSNHEDIIEIPASFKNSDPFPI